MDGAATPTRAGGGRLRFGSEEDRGAPPGSMLGSAGRALYVGCAVLLALAGWPLVAAVEVGQAALFRHRLERARGIGYQRDSEGLVVIPAQGEALRLSWAALATGRWYRHITHTMASGPEESWLLVLPAQGLVLDDRALVDLWSELDRRGQRPVLRSGGRSGGLGGLLLVAWLGLAAVVVFGFRLLG